jgi:hypothetical protein
MTPSPPVTPARHYSCSICGEPSTQICHYCTKDACANHLCARCAYCSDCCRCEIPLEEQEPGAVDASAPDSL